MVVEDADRRSAPATAGRRRHPKWFPPRPRNRFLRQSPNRHLAPPPPPPPAARTYTVVSGDTLWAIAERFYGDGSKYQVIADASGISNPDLIHPGDELTIP